MKTYSDSVAPVVFVCECVCLALIFHTPEKIRCELFFPLSVCHLHVSAKIQGLSQSCHTLLMDLEAQKWHGLLCGCIHMGCVPTGSLIPLQRPNLGWTEQVALMRIWSAKCSTAIGWVLKLKCWSLFYCGFYCVPSLSLEMNNLIKMPYCYLSTKVSFWCYEINCLWYDGLENENQQWA